MLKKYFPFVIFFFLFVLGDLYAQTTAIPDANFEQALIDLGIDKDGTVNGGVATADITVVIELDIRVKGITDLTGIQDFSSLKKLIIIDQLTSLDVSQNTALTLLSCDSNQLTDLNVNGTVALDSLFCSNNQLTSIDISQNMALTFLSCDSNQLTSLNISQNSGLLKVYCYSNQITSLDVSHNTSLTLLNCGGNQITNLDISKNTALTSLGCGANQIINLDLSQNTALTNLSCSGNLFTSLDLSKNINLGELDCNESQLTSLDLSQNTVLGLLYCSNNQSLTSLDLSKNTGLWEVNCSDNQITSLDLSQCTNLMSLFCSSNQLTSLNIKNGNNFQINNFFATNNPSLLCIEVDNETDANAGNWPYSGWQKDDTATYSEDCENYLGVDDELLTEGLKLYPNPVSDMLTVDSKLPLSKVEIYSILGQRVKEINSDFNSISINYLSSGIYMIKIYSEKGITSRKLIKQ